MMSQLRSAFVFLVGIVLVLCGLMGRSLGMSLETPSDGLMVLGGCLLMASVGFLPDTSSEQSSQVDAPEEIATKLLDPSTFPRR